MRLMFTDPAIYKGGKAVFLDRDGVINQRIVGGYVCRWEEFRFSPDALLAVRILSKLELPIIVVSNQAGVAKGLIRNEDLWDLTMAFQEAISDSGGRIDGVYYCLHHPDERCACRKPGSGMLLQAASEWNLSLSECFMVGDADTDILAGASVGCETILVSECAELPERIQNCGCVAAKDFLAACKFVTNRIEGEQFLDRAKDFSPFCFDDQSERVPG